MPNKAKKNYYYGTKFKSLLESRVAYLLDRLNINWKYEPKKIYLQQTDEYYIPDFYLPNHNYWIEAKGAIKTERDKKWKKTDEEIFLFQSDNAKHSTYQNGGINLIECSKCNRYGFVPNLGGWGCRACGYAPGDSDIVYYNIFGENDYIGQQPPLKLIDKETIDTWVTAVQNR